MAALVGSGCGFDQPAVVTSCEPNPDEQALAGGDGSLKGSNVFGCSTAPASPSLWLVLLAGWLLARRGGLLLLFTAFVMPLSAGAQVDSQRIDIGDGDSFPVLWEGDLGEKWTASGTLSFNTANNLAVLEGVPQAGILVNNVATVRLSAGLNLGGVARVGVSAPYHNITFANVTEPGLRRGDLSLWVAIPISQAPKRVRHAWRMRIDLATGPEELLVGDVGVVTGMVASRFPVGPFLGTTNVGVALQQNVPLPGAVWGNHWIYGLGLRAEPFGPTWITAEMQGNAPAGLWTGATGQYPLEMVVSAGVAPTRRLSVGGGFGGGITRGLGSSSFRAIAMVDVRPQDTRDQDGDGIADLRDLCRRVPEDADGFRDRDGCPDNDNDNDGLLDLEDECPNDPEVYNTYHDDDGCPDRIADLEVQLVSKPYLEQATVKIGGARPVVMFAGESIERRLSVDSVWVTATAEGFYPFEVEVPLTSKDDVARFVLPIHLKRIPYGVLRFALTAPDRASVPDALATVGVATPEPASGAWRLPPGEVAVEVRAEGYFPERFTVDVPADAEITVEVTLRPTTVRVDRGRLETDDPVTFALDEDTLDEDDGPILDALAAWLRAHPEVELLRIEGHADNVGSSRYNYELSRRRAEAVRQGLVARGIAPGRLDAIGTGEARPQEDALPTTDQDRRVEFVVLIWADPDPAPAPP